MKMQKFESVWDALEDSPLVAANLTARSDLMIDIEQIVISWHLTQSDAARRLGVSQPRLNDLLRGRIDKFSLDALVNMAAGCGLKVEMHITPSAA
jgi:predicted XRE-type DNA-binding protein